MIQIEWDNKFAVGHARIDHEHQVFLDLIKNTSMINESNAPKDKIMRLLIEVKKYADFHFYSEENIMLDVQYPEYEKHKHEHQVLLSILDEHLHKFNEDSTSIDTIVDFMFKWFALHTTTVDQKLGAYIMTHSAVD